MAAQRNVAIDVMKGMAIIAVIIGHLDVCLDLSGSIPYKVIHKVLYSFHLPLFFIVAGYFYRPGGRHFWKDFKRLVIPYWFTVVVTCLILAVVSLLDAEGGGISRSRAL